MDPEPAGCSCGGLLTVLDRAHTALKVDLSIYSIEAVVRAAYKLTDRCYILLDRNETHAIAYFIAKTKADDVAEWVGAFMNELIDQQLRDQLEKRFAPIRTIITAQAFAEGNLLTSERNDADHNDDAERIGEPR